MNREASFVILGIAAFCGLLFALAYGMASMACHARWAQSGQKTNYVVPGGCLVQRKDGTYVPEKAIREVSSND